MYLILGKNNCPFCKQAVQRLKDDEEVFIYKNLDDLPEEERNVWVNFLKQEVGYTRVPAIFEFVGGLSDLKVW